ncbi:SLC13 family permease [Flavobacterium sp. L1I52]|uniref:SLC13 family permease n=1 Tax=Flavobacterium pokkalii TaxID=1940408 RepID=A0ABR7URA9_9FLAO|nr:SLC13 family permease [Flavobacterium pokkalii]KQB40732.1 Membrane protein, TrkA-C domain pair-containing [Flavobacterium daejeonense]MBD0725244.1 SLC13 family permease [Flavobacterium pokkalii]
MSLEIIIVLVIMVLALYLFVTEKFGIDTVSVIVMILLMVSGILTPQEGFAGFTNPATITVTAMFAISAAVYKSGALSRVVILLNLIGRKSYLLTMVSLMLISGTLSAFMNDTAVVAILLPVTLDVAKKTGINPSKLLMPLSFGALLGGICTLIGTSTNILVSGIAQNEGLKPIAMFEMAPAGLCFLAVGIAYMTFFGSWLLPNRKEENSLAKEYGISQYVTEIILLPEAKSVGGTIKKSPLVKLIDINIIQVIRNEKALVPFPGLVLQAYDVLKISCDIEKLKSLLDYEGIKLKADKKIEDEDLLKDDLILVEALIPSGSKMENLTVKEYNFRQRFEEANVLAIRHRDEILYDSFSKVELKAGDVLLITAFKEEMIELKKSDDLVIISETDHRPFDLKKMLYIVSIVAAVVASAALHIAPIVLTATVGVAVLIALKFLKTEEAYQSINWKVVFMLAGILSLGTALEKTGTATLLASGLVKTLGTFGPQVLLSVFFGLTFLSTNFMSNNATAAILTPIAIKTALELGIDSRPFIMAVAFAASLSFMTPMGYQTNTMIYAPGNYRFKDYLVVGTPLNIILWILATLIIPYFFPF